MVWGAERSLLTILSSKVAKAKDITVFVAPGSPLIPLLRESQINFQTYSFAELGSQAGGGLQRSSAATVARDATTVLMSALAIRRIVRRYDCAVSFGLWETAEVALGARLAGRPCIFDFHVTFDSRRGRLLLRGLMHMLTGAIAPSKATYTQAGLEATGGGRSVVPRPVQSIGGADRVRMDGHDRLRVGIFGQVDPRKSVLEVTQNLGRYQDLIELWVVGTNPSDMRSAYESQVATEIARHGPNWKLIDRVHNPFELMSQCDVVLNASKHESFGRTVVEALQLGALPIVLAGGGPQEIVEQSGFGKVVRSMDDMTEALVDLAKKFRDKPSPLVSCESSRRMAEFHAPDRIAAIYFLEIERMAGRHAI